MSMARVIALCLSAQKGVAKSEVEKAFCRYDYGFENDAHAGSYRQVSLMSLKDIKKHQEAYPKLPYGAYGENILVDDLDLCDLKLGTILQVGAVLLEVIQIGKECHTGCAIAKMSGKCVMPKIGVFAKVIKDGEIHKGDEVKIYEKRFLEKIFDPIEEQTLSKAKVIVVGTGGLGMRVLEILVRSGVKNLRLIDGDIITYRTFDRQLYASEESLGRYKVEVCKEELLKIFGDLKIEVHKTYLTMSNKELILEDAIVIDCLDNIETRLLLEKICEEKGDVLIHGAVDSYFGQVALIRPGDRLLEVIYKDHSQMPQKTFAPLVAIVASLEATLLIEYLLRPEETQNKELIMIDLRKLEIQKIKVEG